MKFIKITALIIAIFVCLPLAACASGNLPNGGIFDDTAERKSVSTSVPNEDGEIGGIGYSKDGDYYKDGYYDMADEAIMDAEMSTYSPSEMTGSPGYIHDLGGTEQERYSAGTLTAGEWRDNRSWADWLTKIAVPEWTEISENWGIYTENRVCVRVTNPSGGVVKNAKVVLYDTDDKVLWSAVTDNEGCAYLFWTSTKANASPNYPGTPTPKSVKVTSDNAQSITAAYSGEETLNVTLDAANSAVKLDLMFVIDTTGSMGDELEYLKAELEDVVSRTAAESGAAVRTSVNFYRDEGDEYVVRYFGFKDDIAEAVTNIRAQSSSGGGDYPEAVHTALDNAINGHAWDEGDSVKLLFLVLDAPPHDDPAVKESLEQSIRAAAEKGIRIIPVISSGTDTTCEVLFRSMAIVTGGTYVFLTNDSGVGGHHTEQSVGDYTVEKLNDLIVRVITEYCA